MDDAELMRRAIALAWGGWGRVGRNPLVGAVVVKDGVVVGEGFHAEFGGRHGEVAALEAAGPKARGADLVVSLEPCVHYGKTPPCSDAIVAAGIRRVVFGAHDVDPKAGGGAGALRRAGVSVVAGVLEQEARAQNAAFFHRFASPRPFVALKLAVSLDGKIADGSGRSQWVSGGEARDYVHWLRAGFDAIAVGAGTATADDPSLTVRGPVKPSRPPLRVALDRRGAVPLGAVMVKTAREIPTLVLLGREVPASQRVALEAAGAQVATADGPSEALAEIARLGMASLLIEGGGVVAGRWLKEGLVDRIHLIMAPILLGGDGVPAFAGVPGTAIEAAERWHTVDRRTLGNDSLLVMDRA